MEKVNVNKMDANKLKDAMRRMDEFKILYENGVQLRKFFWGILKYYFVIGLR